MKRGLLLFAHGARDPRWASPFEDVARRVRAQQPGLEVRLAYLEFMHPDLIEAGSDLASFRCAHVDVVPLFLGAGGHVRKDLPLLIEQLALAHPEVAWRLGPAIGEVDSVVEAMALAAVRLTSLPRPAT